MATTSPTTTAPPRRSDGERTHAAILDAAMRLASIEGLAGLTIGRLARELDVSKSGVFAHFRSKQQLQQETVAAAQAVFEREVLAPGTTAPEGLARLEALCEAYLSYVERRVFPGGCFFAQLLADFDATAGPIHDHLEEGQRGWLALLTEQARTAVRSGDLRPDTDPAQLAFELYAPLELANFLSVLHSDPSIIDRGRAAVRALLTTTSPG